MKDFLRQSIVAKLFMLLAVLLLLMLPLGQIGHVIEERGASQRAAAAELAGTYAGPQAIVGPVIVVPYIERWTELQLDAAGRVQSRVERSAKRSQLLFPQRSDLAGQVVPQERYRGIFKVLFYTLEGRFTGRFAPFDPASLPHAEKDSKIEPLAPLLALVLDDVRGIQGSPQLEMNGDRARFAPRVPGLPDASWMQRGVHAPLPPAALAAWRSGLHVDFRLDLSLVGQEKLAVVPVADDTTARLRSAWPHPSFTGQFLAAERQVSDRGFEARWAVSSLVSAARAQVGAAVDSPKPPELQSFAVNFIEPLNVYSMSTRAIKYGSLFIVLTLAAVLMFELFRKLRLHPVQYALVGFAVALFFLLLVALSEKLPFAAAYAIAAAACVTLLTVYFAAVLGGWRRGLSLGAYVAALYAALYGLLASEDNALLLGSLLLFGLLALLMLATRHVDWYALPRREAAGTAR